MPLNIKDEKVHEAARRLAQLTGQTMTAAVRFAIMEQLQRLEAQAELKNSEVTAAAILALGRECAAALKSKAHSSEHGDIFDAYFSADVRADLTGYLPRQDNGQPLSPFE